MILQCLVVIKMVWSASSKERDSLFIYAIEVSRRLKSFERALHSVVPASLDGAHLPLTRVCGSSYRCSSLRRRDGSMCSADVATFREILEKRCSVTHVCWNHAALEYCTRFTMGTLICSTNIQRFTVSQLG